VSLKVSAGGTARIVGESGSGKDALARSSAAEAPTAGSLRFGWQGGRVVHP